MYVFSEKRKPTKTEPTNKSKGQNFLALWDPPGSVFIETLLVRGQNVLTLLGSPSQRKAIEKNSVNWILV